MGFLFGRRSCHCQCGPDDVCPHCDAACLKVTLADWAGEYLGCDMADLNGEYVLSRGPGYRPGGISGSGTFTMCADGGSPVVLSGTFAYIPESGTYTLDTVTVLDNGDDVAGDYITSVSVDEALIGCGRLPVLSLVGDPIEPPAPTFQINSPTGSGASLSAAWTEVVTGRWGADSVSVDLGGTLYKDKAGVVIATPSCARVTSFAGKIVVDHAEPVLDEITVDTTAGVGATFELEWALNEGLYNYLHKDGFDGQYWRAGAVNILTPGTLYEVGDVIQYTLDGGHQHWRQDLTAPYQAAIVEEVDDVTGAIKKIALRPLQDHFRSDGIIQSVVVTDPGRYRLLENITDATIVDGGVFVPALPSATDGCGYTICSTMECANPEGFDPYDVCRTITVTPSETGIAVSVVLSNAGEIISGELSGDGNACLDTTFEAGDLDTAIATFTTVGSISIEGTECSAEPPAESDACCGDGPPCDEINCVSVAFEFEILLNPWDAGYTPGVDTYTTLTGSATFFCDGTPSYVRTCKDGVASADAGDFPLPGGPEWLVNTAATFGWDVVYGFPLSCDCNSGFSVYLDPQWTGCGTNPVAADIILWPTNGIYQEYARDVIIDGVCVADKVLIRGTATQIQRAAENEDDCGCP